MTLCDRPNWWLSRSQINISIIWCVHDTPDSKVHGANMGPIWGPMLAPWTLLSGTISYWTPQGVEWSCMADSIAGTADLRWYQYSEWCMILYCTHQFTPKLWTDPVWQTHLISNNISIMNDMFMIHYLTVPLNLHQRCLMTLHRWLHCWHSWS